MRYKTWLSVLAITLSVSCLNAEAAMRIEAPADSAHFLGHDVYVEVSGCKGNAASIRFSAILDGKKAKSSWYGLPYDNKWYARFVVSTEGEHSLSVTGFCPKTQTATVRFFTGVLDAHQIGSKVAEHFISLRPVGKMAWDWEDAVFLYGLDRFKERLPNEQRQIFSSFIASYHHRWALKGVPPIDRSDYCPSTLTALSLAVNEGDATGLGAAFDVARYIRTERKNSLGAIDHLGHSWLQAVFPRSMWVDSLMMYGVFAAKFAKFSNDSKLMDFAADQPLLFALKLMDPATGLFRHAWLEMLDVAIPRKDGFWLRGNGWVMASLVDILEELPVEHPRRPSLIALLRHMYFGAATFQLPSGGWDSIMNLPGYSYPETSGTALVAYAFAKGVRLGYLDPSALHVASRAFAYVTSQLVPVKHGLSMPGISGPTIPMQRYFYRFVERQSDKGYGVGAYLLAASEMVHSAARER